MGLDFSIWYKLTLLDEKNVATEGSFDVHKGEYATYEDVETNIPIVKKRGMIIPLK